MNIKIKDNFIMEFLIFQMWFECWGDKKKEITFITNCLILWNRKTTVMLNKDDKKNYKLGFSFLGGSLEKLRIRSFS